MRRLLVAMSLLSAPVHAATVEWTLVATTKNGDKWFVQPKSMQNAGNNNPRVWVRTVNVSLGKFGEKSVVSQVLFNCVKQDATLLSLVASDANGNVVKTESNMSGYITIPPGSAWSLVMEEVCPR
ncbi:hypothetical protein KRZ98_18330 [Sphingobium sp. AS12]|uniref:surface-adhesin E family protein n=1 Tax=Sphingobium sp. AS12 TaxID=2849495 RepID=UPI001C312C48|nr:surface-adhesin E family protein [Sphingobium sp. AS12]MBV2150196.1 hypothetical protein [Sphingobium sp. AS12]